MRAKSLAVGSLVVAAMVGLGVALSMTGTTGGTVLVKVVPRDSGVVLEVTDVAHFLDGLNEAARRVGVDRILAREEKSIVHQLGFDPADRQALAERGLHPDTGLVLFARADQPDLLAAAVRVADRGKFETTLEALISGRTRAQRGEASEIGGVVVERALLPDGQVVVAWGYREDVVVLAAGPGAPQRVAHAIGPRDGSDISDDRDYRRARAQAGADRSLFLFVVDEAAPPDLSAVRAQVRSVGVGFDPGSTGVRADVSARLKTGAFTSLQPFRDRPPASGLSRLLDPSAVLALRVSAHPARVWEMLEVVGKPAVLEAFELRALARGVKLEEQVLPLLEGTVVVDLRPTPSFSLQNLGNFDVRRSNPFLYLHVSAIAPLKDPKAAAELLPRLAEALGPSIGSEVRARTVGPHRVWTVHYRLGEGLSFGIVGDMLVVTGGEGAFEAVVERLANPGHGLQGAIATPGVVERFDENGAVAWVLPVANAVEVFRGMDADRLGGGLAGMTRQLVLRKLLGSLAKVDYVLFDAEPIQGGVSAHLDLGFRPQASGRSE